MNRAIIVLLLLVIVVSCKVDSGTQNSESDSGGLVEAKPGVSSRFVFLLDLEPDSLCFPRSLEERGQVRCVSSSDWTSGFFPGTLIYLSELSGEERFLQRAEEWLPFIEKEKFNDRTHDMGFKVFCSFGNAYRLTQNETYKNIILKSAETLATRFNPATGCIKSWDFGKDRWQFPVIIDNMMNLELLFEATKLSGDSTFYHIAVSHANNTLENHFRLDGSSYHVVDYNIVTGEVEQKLTHQGYSAESVWARGQAWGLYGFTMAYRYTHDSAYLNQAIKIGDFILTHPNMPEDLIPYWDLVDPSIPDAPRDVSAATVIASALVELAQYDESEDFKAAALTIIDNLNSDQYAIDSSLRVPFLLAHSTGNMPKTDEVDVPINYADYYYAEAMVRLKKQSK